MELLFAGLAGILIGIAARFAGRNRDRLGLALVPAWSGIAALATWTLLTWLGAVPALGWLAYDQGWIWWITALVSAAVGVTVAVTLGDGRKKRDEELFDRLRHLGRAAV